MLFDALGGPLSLPHHVSARADYLRLLRLVDGNLALLYAATDRPVEAQAALLAAIVAEKSGLPLRPNLLVRAKRTRRQVGLSRVQRADNLQGAFRVPEEARPQLEGRHVLLVDDVLTTGATANAAARALLRGGARQVDLLSFARVVTDG